MQRFPLLLCERCMSPTLATLLKSSKTQPWDEALQTDFLILDSCPVRVCVCGQRAHLRQSVCQHDAFSPITLLLWTHTHTHSSQAKGTLIYFVERIKSNTHPDNEITSSTSTQGGSTIPTENPEVLILCARWPVGVCVCVRSSVKEPSALWSRWLAGVCVCSEAGRSKWNKGKGNGVSHLKISILGIEKLKERPRLTEVGLLWACFHRNTSSPGELEPGVHR